MTNTTQLPRIILDTSVLLEALIDRDTEDAQASIELLYGHGKNHEIYLPSIVIPELAHIRKRPPEITSLKNQLSQTSFIHNWLQSNDIKVCDLTPSLAVKAATYVHEYDLAHGDAIVLATAVHYRCSTLYTRDTDLLKRKNRVRENFQVNIQQPPPPESLFTM